MNVEPRKRTAANKATRKQPTAGAKPADAADRALLTQPPVNHMSPVWQHFYLQIAQAAKSR